MTYWVHPVGDNDDREQALVVQDNDDREQDNDNDDDNGDNDDREQALVVQEPPLTYCHITRPPVPALHSTQLERV